MPTSVHIPKPLLDAVDRKAKSLRVSRNRLIVAALEREMSQTSDWSPGFFEQLTPLSIDASNLLEDSLAAVRAHRRSKKSPRL